MRRFTVLFTLLAVCAMAQATAAIRTEKIEYKLGEVVMEGYLAFDDASTERRPGVVVFHEWMGLNEYSMSRARQLAELGYVAFAADMYGKGVRPTSREEAGKLSGGLKGNRQLMRARAIAALETLRKSRLVDVDRIAAIGYCFGGTAALELGRAGGEVRGIVSFHGGLDSPTPLDAKNIKGKVLVLHGADDPSVPPAQVAAFEDEMRKANIDWQLVAYGGAVHAFTNPSAGNDNSKGAAYNEKADKRSWEAMKTFFGEIFG